jgi:putative ATP-binding cassette transporter
MRGVIEFGTVTQAAMAFCHVLGAFSLIVKEFQRITTFAAVVKRLGTFWEATEAPTPVAAAGEASLGVEFGSLPRPVVAENA